MTSWGNSAVFWLKQQISRVESQCMSETTKVRNLRTMRDVVTSLNISVSPEVRCLPEVRQAKSKLRSNVAARMEELLHEQFALLSESKTVDDFKKLHAKLLKNDWCFLRGEFPFLYDRAIKTSNVLQAKIQRLSDG